MSGTPPRLVLDTNTVVRAFSNWDSPSGIIIAKCRVHDFQLLLSKPVLAEYRRVLKYGRVVMRHPDITDDAVADMLEKLRYGSEFPLLRGFRFRLDRDPSDEKIIELAIAGSATHLITRDQDLLSLPADHSDSGKRFRQRLPVIKVLRPEQFLAAWKRFN